MTRFLLTAGHRVQQQCVRESMRRVDPYGAFFESLLKFEQCEEGYITFQNLWHYDISTAIINSSGTGPLFFQRKNGVTLILMWIQFYITILVIAVKTKIIRSLNRIFLFL